MAPLTVLRIEVAGPDRRARRLFFDADHAEHRLTSSAAVRALALEEGDLVDLSQLASVEADLARDRALRFLGYRDRTSHEIVKRLADDGYPNELAEAVCERLRELGYVDDARLAQSYARSRAGSGYGSRRILQDLLRRGVPGELAEETLAAQCGDPDAAAHAALRGRRPSNKKERQRLVRRLLSRGFDLSTALKATEFDETD